MWNNQAEWEMDPAHLGTLLAPLNLTEACTAGLLAAAAPPDASTEDLSASMASILNRRSGRSGGRALSAANIASVMQRGAGRCPSLQQAAFLPGLLVDMQCQLTEEGLGIAAAPPISICPRPGCGGALQTAVESRGAWFYADTLQPQQGVLYQKECSCGTVCFLNGWEDGTESVAPGAKRRRRQVYSNPAHWHTTWFRASKEAVVSVQLLRRHDAELVHMNGSFEAACKVFNETQGIRECAFGSH